MNKEINYERISEGRRTDCYLYKAIVLKLPKKSFPREEVLRHCIAIKEDYQKIRKYLDPYVLPTQFVVGEKGKDSTEGVVLAVQPYLQGTSLKEAISSARAKGADLKNIGEFLEKCLSLYKETGLVPDIFGKQHLYGWYKFLSTPNVIIVKKEDGSLYPYLVDFAFARVTTDQHFGPMANRLLVEGVKRTLNSIKS